MGYKARSNLGAVGLARKSPFLLAWFLSEGKIHTKMPGLSISAVLTPAPWALCFCGCWAAGRGNAPLPKLSIPISAWSQAAFSVSLSWAPPTPSLSLLHSYAGWNKKQTLLENPPQNHISALLPTGRSCKRKVVTRSSRGKAILVGLLAGWADVGLELLDFLCWMLSLQLKEGAGSQPIEYYSGFY